MSATEGEREIVNVDSPVTDENKNYNLLMQHGRD
jgi:hypothetical protein